MLVMNSAKEKTKLGAAIASAISELESAYKATSRSWMEGYIRRASEYVAEAQVLVKELEENDDFWSDYNFSLSEWLKETNHYVKSGLIRRPLVYCKDGYALSIQAGPGMYSTMFEPSTNITYTGMLSDPIPTLMYPDKILSGEVEITTVEVKPCGYDHGIDPCEYLGVPDAAFFYVPLYQVEELIRAHGGYAGYNTDFQP